MTTRMEEFEVYCDGYWIVVPGRCPICRSTFEVYPDPDEIVIDDTTQDELIRIEIDATADELIRRIPKEILNG